MHHTIIQPSSSNSRGSSNHSIRRTLFTNNVFPGSTGLARLERGDVDLDLKGVAHPKRGAPQNIMIAGNERCSRGLAHLERGDANFDLKGLAHLKRGALQNLMLARNEKFDRPCPP